MSKEVEERALVKVKAVPRFHNDLVAMNVKYEGDKPYRDPVRVRKNGWVGCGMGGTSGDGFESAFFIDGVLLFRYSQLASSISEVSSNYRKLRHLVEALKSYARKDKLRDCELFLLMYDLFVERNSVQLDAKVAKVGVRSEVHTSYDLHFG